MPMCRFFLIVFFILLSTGCGGNPYLDASLETAELDGKTQDWFIENWGQPQATSPRFFGGETWTYIRIAGGETHPPFYNFSPNECRINLKFDEEGRLDSYSYSDC